MTRTVYHFGDCRIDPAMRVLRRADEPVAVSPKVFDCIEYLIEHRDRAVGRDELIAAVWGKTDVAYTLLGQLIAKVRRALGKSGNDQSLISTIPRFGYRWVAQIRADDEEADPSISQAVATPRARREAVTRGPRNAVKIGIGLLVVLALLAVVYAWQFPVHAPDTAMTGAATSVAVHQQRDAYAVLPVDVGMKANTESAWMRLGLMDFIASHLRRSGLSVVPSSDMVALARDGPVGAAMRTKVRTATGAQNVVEASANATPDGWVLRLVLHAADGKQRIVETKALDTIAAARGATNRLLDRIGRTLPESAEPTSTTEFLQRVEAAVLINDTRHARRLIEAAPAVLRELAESQLYLASIEDAVGDTEAARDRFENLLASASAEGDPVLRARALIGLGRTEFDEPDLAARRFSEAVALLENRSEPAYLGDAYNGRGIASARAGRPDDAHADYARARIAYMLASDSLRLARVDNNEALLDIRNGRPAEALPLLKRAALRLERFGAIDTFAYALTNQIGVHLVLLQPDEALQVYEQALSGTESLDNSPAFRILGLLGATALAANGRLSESRAQLDSLASNLSTTRESDVLAAVDSQRAQLELAAGRHEQALTLARRAVDGLAGPSFLSYRADAWLTMIRTLRALHRPADAEVEMTRFSAWTAGWDHAAITIRARIAEAEQAWSEGRYPTAENTYADALRLAHHNGAPLDVAAIVNSQGTALLDSGNLIKASVLIGQIGRWSNRDFTCALLQARLYHALGRHEAWRSALDSAQALAGERAIPAELMSPPPAITVSVRD